jgi:hypothetical protein
VDIVRTAVDYIKAFMRIENIGTLTLLCIAHYIKAAIDNVMYGKLFAKFSLKGAQAVCTTQPARAHPSRRCLVCIPCPPLNALRVSACVCVLRAGWFAIVHHPPCASTDRYFYKYCVLAFLYPATSCPYFAGVQHWVFLKAYMQEVDILLSLGPVRRCARARLHAAGC